MNPLLLSRFRGDDRSESHAIKSESDKSRHSDCLSRSTGSSTRNCLVAYVHDIGIRYLLIPIIATDMGAVAQRA